MRLGEFRLQPERFGKLRGCTLRVRLLHQHGTEIVVQFRPLRLQFDRTPKLADGAVEIPGKIENTPQDVMSLGIVRRQTHRLFGLA